MIGLIGRAARFPHRRKTIANWLFGIKFGPLSNSDYYYDFGTVALVGRAKKILEPGTSLLDLGCGAHAVIGLALWRACNSRVLSVDINPELVDLARATAKLNGNPISVKQSRFFDDLGGFEFDTVIFNPPYVPTQAAHAMALPKDRESQWHGGEDGLKVIDDFMFELAAYPKPITALISNNRMLVPRKKFNQFLSTHENVTKLSEWHHPFLPIDVHTMTSTRQEIAQF